MLQKYKEELNKMAVHTGDRKSYRQLVGLLRRMKGINGGSQMAKDIAEEWKSKYRNRRAMMEELGKL